jgi:hypothetical protein
MISPTQCLSPSLVDKDTEAPEWQGKILLFITTKLFFLASLRNFACRRVKVGK